MGDTEKKDVCVWFPPVVAVIATEQTSLLKHNEGINGEWEG